MSHGGARPRSRSRRSPPGRLGRKAGRGYYEYPASGEHRPADPDPPPVGGGDGVVVIAGETPLAEQLREAAGEAGWAVADPLEARELATPFLILDLTGIEEPEAPLQGAPQAICLAAGSLASLDPGGSGVGFHALPPAALDATCRADPRSGLSRLRRRGR